MRRSALTKVHGPRQVFSQVPHYGAYKTSVSYFQSSLFQWSETCTHHDTIEFVTSPNNPDGTMRTPYCCTNSGSTTIGNSSFCQTVYDMAYLWPHFTPISTPVAHDIMLFTLSKLTGHGGSRIGWAFVRNKVIARHMEEFITTMTLGVSHEAQLRAARLLQVSTSER